MKKEIIIKEKDKNNLVKKSFGYFKTYIVLKSHVNRFGIFKYISPFNCKRFNFFELNRSLKKIKINENSYGDNICSGGFISFINRDTAENVAKQLAHENNGRIAFDVIECIVEHGSKYAIGYNEHFKTEGTVISNKIRLITLLSSIK